jgi:uncharacterized DUF497 family protein
MYNHQIEFVWDEAKNRKNIGKHRLPFELANLVFQDQSFKIVF